MKFNYDNTFYVTDLRMYMYLGQRFVFDYTIRNFVLDNEQLFQIFFLIPEDR